MATNGKIYITITDKPIADNFGEEKEKKSEKDLLKNYVFYKALDFAKNEISTMVNYSFNNIGNFTGNYQTQQHIQETIKSLNFLKNIGMSAIAGAKFGAGGAIAGAIFSFATQTVNVGLSEFGQYFANKKMNHNIDMLRQLSGLNQLSDGSRGTLG